jgi:hypothetical protein
MLLMMKKSYIEAGGSVNPIFGSFSETFAPGGGFHKKDLIEDVPFSENENLY